jgi:hypothetical protein
MKGQFERIGRLIQQREFEAYYCQLGYSSWSAFLLASARLEGQNALRRPAHS